MKKVDSTSLVLLIVLAIIWGTSFILMKRAMFDAEGAAIFSAHQVAALRVFLAGLCLLPFAIPHLKLLKSKSLPYLLIVGVIGTAIPAFLFTEAQQVIDSALSGMLNALVPIWTFLLGISIFKVPFRKNGLVGVLIGLIGAAGLVYFKDSGPIELSVHALLIVIATAMYGTSVNTMKTFLSDIPSLTISAVALAVVMPIGGIYAWHLGSLDVIQHHEKGMEALMYIAILALFSTAIGLVLFNKLIKRESAVFAASVTYFMPIVAIIWGVLDDEKVQVIQILFIGLILLGVWYVNRGKRAST